MSTIRNTTREYQLRWWTLAVVAVIGGFFVVPNSRNPNPKRLDVPGAVLSTGGLALLIYGLIESGRLGWNTTEVLAIADQAWGAARTAILESSKPTFP